MDSAKHSGIGIASFISGLIFALLTLVAVIAGDGLAAVTPGDLEGGSITAILLGAALAGATVSLRLGVGGVSQENRNKRFAVL
ncbi:MAG TPA: hypothetical protein VFK45_05775, partial [Gammaproteobacteria bacterium]|nr:hypothetical protein [Gammaproteobacteria bacterium]